MMQQLICLEFMWYDVYEGKADADTWDCGTVISQCSEYPHLFNLGESK